MPLMGARTKNILSGDLSSPEALVIQELSGVRRLSWLPVFEAATYVVSRSENVDGPFAPIAEAPDTTYDDSEALPGLRYFYRITAKAGF